MGEVAVFIADDSVKEGAVLEFFIFIEVGCCCFRSGCRLRAGCRSVPIGATIKAVARILHKGKNTHVWNVDIFNEEGQLCFTSRVTNYMLDLKNKK